MRIGLFTDAYLPDINGVVSSVATLKEALEEQGHVVYVISNHKGTDIVMEDHILRLGGLELKKFYGYKMSSPIQIRAEKYVRDMHLDVIHVQTEAGIGIFGRQMAKALRLPLVYTYHTMYEDYTHYVNPLDFEVVEKMGRKAIRSLSRILGNGAQAVIAPSEKTRQALMQYGVKTPIYVVPTGLNLSAFDRGTLDEEKVRSIRSSIGLSSDDHVVVFLGRIAKEKSIDIPIRAVAMSDDPGLHLVVVGGGTDEGYYKELAAKYKVTDRVHFLGRKAKDDVPYYYAAFDCFVSASLSETQGMTYIEALAVGLPVFGRRDEVLFSLLDEGETGYYFDDEKELVKKWKQFFSLSNDDRLLMRKACTAKTKPYSTRMFASKALAVYEQAIDDFRQAFTVEKVKVSEDFVKLTLKRDSDSEPLSIKIPMDDYWDYRIQPGTVLDAYVVEEYRLMQEFFRAYSGMKRRVLQKDFTSALLKKECMRKYLITPEEADMLVRDFENRGWVDDREYALEKAQIGSIQGLGINKIAAKLKQSGIRSDHVQEALESVDEKTQLEAAVKQAKQFQNSIRDQSLYAKKQTITQKLITKGYTDPVARQAVDALEWPEDDEAALDACFKKAKRLFASKPEDQRQEKIIQYCRRKGFSYALIREKIESEPL